MRLCVVAGYVGVFVWILRGVHVIVCSCGICRCFCELRGVHVIVCSCGICSCICVDIERFT